MLPPPVLVRITALLIGIVAACSPAMTSAQEVRNGLLWEVRSPTTRVFLLGTIHVGSRDLFPLPAAVEAAYAVSSTLALEADLSTEASIAAVGTRFVYAPPDNLEQHIPPALFRQAADTLDRYGLPPDVGRAMKPHMLSMALMLFEAGRIGLDASLGLDLHLTRRAHADGKRIMELESVAMQADLLEGLSAQAQVAMLDSTVRGIRDGSLSRDLAALMEAWLRGDADRLQTIAEHEFSRLQGPVGQELEKRLYTDRNIAMAEQVVAMLSAQEIVLVAVGAGHMTGPHGLVNLLRDRGYEVVQRSEREVARP
jgi:uncharacterized protein YbaP (TraB family)